MDDTETHTGHYVSPGNFKLNGERRTRNRGSYCKTSTELGKTPLWEDRELTKALRNSRSNQDTTNVPVEASFIQEATGFDFEDRQQNPSPMSKSKPAENVDNPQPKLIYDPEYLFYLKECAQIIHKYIPKKYYTTRLSASEPYIPMYDCQTCNVGQKGPNFYQHLRGKRHQALNRTDLYLMNQNPPFPPRPPKHADIFVGIKSTAVDSVSNDQTQLQASTLPINSGSEPRQDPEGINESHNKSKEPYSATQEYVQALEVYYKQCADILEPWFGRYRIPTSTGVLYRCETCCCECAPHSIVTHFKGRRHQNACPQDYYIRNENIPDLPSKPNEKGPSSDVVESKSANEMRQALYNIDFTISPCLGVEFIVEFSKSRRSDGSIDENVVFICDLCAKEIKYHRLVKHVLSDGHRIHYLTREYPEVALQLKQSFKQDQRGSPHEIVTQLSMKVQRMEGTPKIIRVVDEVYMSDIHVNSKRRPGVPYFSAPGSQNSSSSFNSFPSDPISQHVPLRHLSAPSAVVSNFESDRSINTGVSSFECETSINTSSSYQRMMQQLQQSVNYPRSTIAMMDVQSTSQPILTHNTPFMQPSLATNEYTSNSAYSTPHTTNSAYKRPFMQSSDPSYIPHSTEKKSRLNPIQSSSKPKSVMGSFLEILKNTDIKNEDDATLATQIISILSQALVQFRSFETSHSNGTKERVPSPVLARFETDHSRNPLPKKFASVTDELVDIVQGNEQLLALLNKMKNS